MEHSQKPIARYSKLGVFGTRNAVPVYSVVRRAVRGEYRRSGGWKGERGTIRPRLSQLPYAMSVQISTAISVPHIHSHTLCRYRTPRMEFVSKYLLSRTPRRCLVAAYAISVPDIAYKLCWTVAAYAISVPDIA
eukprot:3745471-Rhodomonas_salina.1